MHHRTERGFSLLELLAAASLASLLMMVALPRLARPDDRSVAERLARQVAGDLQVARMRALARQEDSVFTLDAGTRSYVITPANLRRDLPGHVAITPPGVTSFGFDSRGYLTAGAAVTLTLTSHGHATTVQVTPVGQIALAHAEAP